MIAETYASELLVVPVTEADRVLRFLEQAPNVSLRDLAFSCSKLRGPQPVAVVASSPAEARARLASAVKRIADGAERVRDKSGTWWYRRPVLGPDGTGKLAFVFPGATSFYPDMLRELVVCFPECRRAFDELEEALAGRGGPFSPVDFIFPPAPCYRRDADVFSAGGYAQAMVSVYTANAALARLFTALGVVPDAVTGFSGGDLNALAWSGSLGKFRRKDRLKFLQDIYKVVDTAVNRAGLAPCVLAAVVTPDPAAAEAALAAFATEQVCTCVHFSPRQRVLALAPDAAEAVQKALGAVGARGVRLDADKPFNTPWCASALSVFRKFAGHWVDDGAKTPVYSCGTAEPLPQKVRHAREESAALWTRPVRFAETIRRMHADGVTVFLEVGPRGVAANAVDEILRGEPHVALAANSAHRSSMLQLLHAAGTLAALGAPVDTSVLYAGRRCREVDLDAPLAAEVRAETVFPLHRDYPRLTLIASDPTFGGAMAGSAASTPAGRSKAAQRAAAVAARERRQRQFDFGAANPLISSAETLDLQPGVSIEILKTLSFAEEPFVADFALGTSQVSYSERDLRGLTLLPLVVSAEIMAELAQTLVEGGRRVAAVDDLLCRRPLAFDDNGRLALRVRAERVSSPDPAYAAVKVQIRDGASEPDWTWAATEAVFLLTAAPAPHTALAVEPLAKQNHVHWIASDIYPDRLLAGESLRGIRKADLCGPGGIDYEVEVPSPEGALKVTGFPLWALNPQLLAAITDGFSLWRTRGLYEGALSFAFRLRHLALHAASFPPGMRLKAYLRLSGVTPESHIANIAVSDGNGNLLLDLRGYEERTERMPPEYRRLFLAPAGNYLTRALAPAELGEPHTTAASAVIADVPYAAFKRSEEVWLRAVARIVLAPAERADFASMTGSAGRRTEWLFGRIAAKEAVRRFLQEGYQARWGDADVQIWADDQGKPHALGPWQEFLAPGANLDLAIAHTAQFVAAVVAVNARVGIDVEARDRDLSEEFVHGVFTERELALVERAVSAPSAALRFWCAKEAVSKALGTGIRYSPKELEVAAFQPDAGEMEVALRGQWLDAFKQFTGRTVRVASSVIRGHVFTVCYIPDSLFA